MSVTNRLISVSYRMYVHDSESPTESLTEECKSFHPFRFITHLGMVLKAFEDELEKLPVGSHFDFVITPENAYGEFQEDLMFDVPKSAFEVDGEFDKRHIKDGNVIQLQDKDGQLYNATVIEVKDEAVTIDLNHPHAGDTLHFIGDVLQNREATSQELTAAVNEMSCNGSCSGCQGCGGH